MRPAAPGYAAHIRLHKHLSYSPILFGVKKEYLKAVVRVPLCRACGRAWPANTVVYTVTGCSGCLVVAMLILSAVAVGLNFLWKYAIAVAVGAVLIAGLAKWYELRHRPKGTGLRDPYTYPEVRALLDQGYKLQ